MRQRVSAALAHVAGTSSLPEPSTATYSGPMRHVHRAVSGLAPFLLGLTLLGLPAAPTHQLPASVPAAAARSSATLPSVTFVRRAAGLDQAVAVTSAKDGSSRLFVSEKAGLVRVVRDGTVARRPFLDLRSRVRADGEGGLLSIAFHPDYRHHHLVWVAYTDRAGDLRIDRFRARTARAGHALLSSRVHLLDVPHPVFTNHYSGQLVFGRTGLLFVSTGDGGSAGDPNDHAQDISSLEGKILRLRVLGAHRACGHPFCIPPGNPYAGSTPGRAEIWASGVRNAWRFSVDPVTGDLWIGDVGQDRFEEVDHLRAGQGGANLGWSCREGTSIYDASRCRSGTTYVDPVWTYDHSYGQALIGGFVYRGARYAGVLGGRYLGGDYESGRVFVGTPTGISTVGHLDQLTSFGVDDGRELWATTLTGGLYEVRAA
jgi:glucose/arabinose dehydrogenase